MPSGDHWDIWLVLGGRGTGKTRAGAEAVLEHLERLGSFARVGIGAPTTADVRDVCAEGVSGLISIARDRFVSYNRSLGEAHHKNGGYVKFLGAEEPGRWNGPQWSLLWADELALWNQDSWEQAQFGLRLGDHPRAIATTTPKSRQFVRDLADLPSTHVTRATTADNPHLSQVVRDRLYERYGGTRLGRQELDAEILLDTPGALWTRGMLDATRVKQDGLPDMARIVVAIDPSGGSDEGHDEQGIIVAGRGVDGHAYLLEDISCRLSPDGWGRRAVNAYHHWQADRILAEINYGGAMVEHVVKVVDPSVSYKEVHASRGKVTRAEPIAALYEQGRAHHVGSFPALEDQLCVVAGTQVLTARGSVSVECVVAGDLVWTRAGWRPVAWAGETGVARSLVTIEAEGGRSITCTLGHPVWVDGCGFMPAAEVQSGCIIHTCQFPSPASLSSIAASNISVSDSRTDVSTTALRVVDRAREDFSTLQSGQMHTGRFPKAGTSITGIGTDCTTRLTTCSLAPRQITSGSMADDGARGRTTLTPARVVGERNGRADIRARSNAAHVGLSLSQPGSAPRSARERVSGVRHHSRSIDLPVYNLRVLGQPEYFANGILTHNCSWTADSYDGSPDRLDALVWALTDLMLTGAQLMVY